MTKSEVEAQPDELVANSDRPSQFELDLRSGVDDFLSHAKAQLDNYTEDNMTMYYSVDVVSKDDMVFLIFKHTNKLPDAVQELVQQGKISQ